jgi:hypothetical protein
VAAEKTIAAKANQSSALLNLMPHAMQTLKREPALGITLCYLLVAMAGIFYNYSFYQKFGIPILTLSQIADFLVAGIQQPMALLLVLSTFPLCWLLDRVNAGFRARRIVARDRLRSELAISWWQRTRLVWLTVRTENSWYMGLIYAIAIVGYGSTFVGLYANHRADAVRRGDAPKVAIWLNGDAAGLAAKSGQSWTYLGAISNYVFVYDAASRHAVILPVNGIARIEPVAQEDAQPSIIVAPIP